MADDVHEGHDAPAQADLREDDPRLRHRRVGEHALEVGLHAAHVVGAVGWLLGVMLLAWRRRFSAHSYLGVRVCATYWFFVCALWLVIFPLVYLT